VTATALIGIERLLHLHCPHPFAFGDTKHKLGEVQRLLRRAIENEQYSDIDRHEKEISFILRGAAIQLAKAAITAGDLDLAEQLPVWGRDGVPSEIRDEFTDILLNK
jgi:hypothetical protein